jgi:hypothetical protein
MTSKIGGQDAPPSSRWVICLFYIQELEGYFVEAITKLVMDCTIVAWLIIVLYDLSSNTNDFDRRLQL